MKIKLDERAKKLKEQEIKIAQKISLIQREEIHIKECENEVSNIREGEKIEKKSSISDKFNNLIEENKISPKEKDDDSLVKISDGESMIEKNSQKDSPNGKKNSKEKTVNTYFFRNW